MAKKFFVGCFTLLIFISTAFITKGQTYYTSTEWGVAFGASQYFGDLNTNYGFKTVTPAVGIYMRKHMNPYIALKFVANYTQVSYDDKYNTDAYEQARNLNFTSPIVEVITQAEFNFFKFITGDPFYRWTPFLTGGAGVFYYNPYTTYNGQNYNLRPLGTEGQNTGTGKPYSPIGVVFPIGMGVKYWLKGGINLTLEITDRLTTTDYLDDVSSTYAGANKFPPGSIAAILQNRTTDPNSDLNTPGKQRGNTSSKDQYAMCLLSLSWHFVTYKCPAFMTQDLIKTTR